MKLYGKDYSESYIKNHESKKDIFRVKYLEPYLKRFVGKIPGNSKILDIGCGWGVVPNFTKKTQSYYGMDVSQYFLDYVKRNFKGKNIHLAKGSLPSKIPFEENDFDVVICSMVLHAIGDLRGSVNALFKKSKSGGKVLIVDFVDSAKEFIKNQGFLEVSKKTDKYMAGTYALPSGIVIPAEVYFHKEKDYEREIMKYGKFKKRKVGSLFAAWECIKNET